MLRPPVIALAPGLSGGCSLRAEPERNDLLGLNGTAKKALAHGYSTSNRAKSPIRSSSPDLHCDVGKGLPIPMPGKNRFSGI